MKKSIFSVKKVPFTIKKDSPTIFITGGSLGSHSINKIVEQITSSLLKKYIVIHQTGNVQSYQDFKRLSSLKKKLPAKLSQRYFLKEHFYDEEIGYVYSLSDIVISRAGANTFFELIALKKPAIFIPLPWSAGQEQARHAEIFTHAGAGKTFKQDDDPRNLILLIQEMLQNLKSYQKSFNNLDSLYKKNATKLILETIFKKY